MRRMLLLTALVPIAALAQSPTLPDVVVTATRVPTLIERIPAGVTVIDRAAIEASGYSTLTEALATVPGVRVVQSGGNGGNASLFIRGTNSNHVLVLRDGVPVNDPSDPGGLFNFGVDSLADVERIEVIRGPMSSLYGSGAIGGVVNLISRRGLGAPQGTAEIAAGLPAQARAAATLSGSTGRFDYSLTAEARDEAGFDTTPRRQSIYTGARNPYRSATATINLGAELTEETRATAFLRGRSATFLLDSLGFPAYDANSYRGFDTTVSGRFALTHLLFDGAWQTTLGIGQLNTDRHYRQPLEAADPNATSSDTRYHGRRSDLRWDNTIHLSDTGPASGGAVIFGASRTIDTAHSALVANFGGFPYQNTTRASAASNAGHLGGQTTLWQRLSLSADIRAEDAKYGGAAVTWRAGAVFAIPEAWSRAKLSYGTAFRAPSLYDLFGADTSGYVGNAALKPERSEGYEIGWAIDVPGAKRKPASFEITYFKNRINNLIQIVYGPGFTSATSQNVDRASTQGFETSLTLRPAEWLEAMLDFTRTETRDLGTGAALLRRPRDQASLTLRATPLPGLTVAPEIIYTGAFQDFLSDDNGFPTGVGRAHPGTIMNLTASYVLDERFTLFAIGRNLGNSRFEPANGFQTPGTSALVGLRARF